MSNSKREDDFFIKIDDIDNVDNSSSVFIKDVDEVDNSSSIFITDIDDVDNSSSVFITDNTFKQSSKPDTTDVFLSNKSKIEDTFMTNNTTTDAYGKNTTNNDYFIKIDDGDIVDQNKEKNELYLMNETKNDENIEQDIPHYNSPEYAEYMSKLNKDNLKEISMESINNDSLTYKLKEEVNEKYGKKKVQKFLSIGIIVLFVASIITFGIMLKGGGNTKNVAEKELADFDFLLKVAISSSSTSLEYYNELKDISEIRSGANQSIQNVNINKIKKSVEENLNEVNILKDYIDVDNYEDIVKLLRERYENLVSLCDELYINSANTSSIYNNYAKKEISIVDSLNAKVIEKLDYFNIPYKVENNAVVLVDR